MSEHPADLFSVQEIESLLDSGEAEYKNGQVVRVGGLEGTMIVRGLEPVTLWNRRTGLASKIIPYNGNNTILKKLADRDDRGERIWTTAKPDVSPPDPQLLCPFQPGHEQYDLYHSQGYAPCSKRGRFPSQQEVMNHVRNKHGRALAQIEREERETKERDAAERQQRTANAMLQAIQVLAGARSEAPAEPEEAPRTGFACESCTFASATEQGLKTHIGRVHGGD